MLLLPPPRRTVCGDARRKGRSGRPSGTAALRWAAIRTAKSSRPSRPRLPRPGREPSASHWRWTTSPCATTTTSKTCCSTLCAGVGRTGATASKLPRRHACTRTSHASTVRRCRAADPDTSEGASQTTLGRSISPTFRRRTWAPAIEAAGITTPARIYDLRSTFASNALAAGMSVFELARMMGTSGAMIERHYGTLIEGAGADIARRPVALDIPNDRRPDHRGDRGPG